VEPVSYGLDNARFQWEEGERRLEQASPRERPRLDRAVTAVLGELRRRLGSSYRVEELAELYAEGTDWADSAALDEGAGTDSAWVVDAAFHRYASGAADYAGGRRRGLL
jgi:hypothetical protein